MYAKRSSLTRRSMAVSLLSTLMITSVMGVSSHFFLPSFFFFLEYPSIAYSAATLAAYTICIDEKMT